MTPEAILATARDFLVAGQSALKASYEEDGDALRFLRGRAALVDAILAQLWERLGMPQGPALAAVGGYGRGELYPASDVDILILLSGDPGEAGQEQLHEFIRLLWDIGLEIGHSVRTVEECLQAADDDITIKTNLLESRFICGNQLLFRGFSERFRAGIRPQRFFKGKRIEQSERYQRFQETAYSLEPNCKESPGGLRDLQMIRWIALAAGYGSEWKDLARHGFITPDEARQLGRRERFLQHLRITLHHHTGRREDRLLFDHQDKVAGLLGIKPGKTRRASEMLMQRYYRTAKAVTQLNTILLQNMGAAIFPHPEETPRLINDRFQIVHDLLDVRDESLFDEHPQALFESFALMQAHADLKGMTARTLRALWRGRNLIGPAFRSNPANRQAFLNLFKAPRGIVHEFRRMNHFNVLGRYLPAFGKVVGQMQHDLFHVYTVDQHILQVLRNLRRFTMHEFAHEYPYCSRLIADFNRPWVLYVAAIFHDIAKGRGGDHSQLGMEDAERFCRQHGIDDEDRQLIVWLVGEHLVMSHVAQKQDLSDPDVIRSFAARMQSERHLTALYLLTVADIRGTSPKVWNPWRARLLEQLYRAALQVLAGDAPPMAHGVIQQRQEEALGKLRFHGLMPTAHEALWKRFDTGYFLRHEVDDIVWHTRVLYWRVDAEEPVVRTRMHQVDRGVQVMVYAADRKDLFAHLCGFFSRFGYSIVDARVHTTSHGYALDSFVLLALDSETRTRDMLAYIEHELANDLRKEAPAKRPSQGRLSRQVRHFPIDPEVSIQSDERGDYYALSLTAADRPGLLFDVAQCLADRGISIHTAKIGTLGERVEDTLLIMGESLKQSSGRIRLERELLEMLQL